MQKQETKLRKDIRSPESLQNTEKKAKESKNNGFIPPLLQIQKQCGNQHVQKLSFKSRQTGNDKELAPDIEDQILKASGGGQAINNKMLLQMESAFSADFNSVRVHTDSNADRLNQELNSRAFTIGHDIFFRKGEYVPEKISGQELLAHELTHVVQQNSGIQCKLTIGRSDNEYEQDADRVAQIISKNKGQFGRRQTDIKADESQSKEKIKLGQTKTAFIEDQIPTKYKFKDGTNLIASSPIRILQKKDTNDAKKRRMATAAITLRMPIATTIGAAEYLSINPWKPLFITDRTGAFFEAAKTKNKLSVLEDWIGQYNKAAPSFAGVLAALGRMNIIYNSGIDYKNPEVYEEEFRNFGLIAEADPDAKELRAPIKSSPSIEQVLYEMRSAQDTLSAVGAELAKQRNIAVKAKMEAEKANLQEKVAQINKRIESITEIIQIVEQILAMVATAYATAGTSLAVETSASTTEVYEMATKGQAFVQGMIGAKTKIEKTGISVPKPSVIVDWILQAKYAEKLSNLNSKINEIDTNIGKINKENFNLDMSAAKNKLSAAKNTLAATQEKLKNSISARRSQIHDLASHIDQLRMEDIKRSASSIKAQSMKENIRTTGAARSTALMTLGESVIEFMSFLKSFSEQIKAMKPEGIELIYVLLMGSAQMGGTYEGFFKISTEEGEQWALKTILSDEVDRVLIEAFRLHSDCLVWSEKAVNEYSPIAKGWIKLLTHVIPYYK